MKNLVNNEEKLIKILKLITITMIILQLICGITSMVIGEDVYFICLSLWAVSGFLMLFFHAYPMYGWKKCVGIVLIGCIVSLFFESMGCNFGIFFSKYIYTDYIPGPKLFGFNVYSMIAYGIGVYLLWAVVKAAFGQYGRPMTKKDIFLMPILGSVLFVTADYATDPILSTIHQTHIWEKPGVYYGIPWQNYMGWYVMAYAIYFCIALYIYFAEKNEKLPKEPSVAKRKAFWISPTLLYFSLWIQFPFYAMIKEEHLVTVASNGQSFMTSQIYWGVFIVMIGAMVPVTLTTIMRVLSDKDLR